MSQLLNLDNAEREYVLSMKYIILVSQFQNETYQHYPQPLEELLK